MGFWSLSISHEQADAALRERVHHAVAAAYADAAIPVVVISTCVRIEVCGEGDALRTQCRGWFPLTPRERCGADAVLHLFRVTAGLDSPWKGERDAAVQVKRAYTDAAGRVALPSRMHRLFQRALATASHARKIFSEHTFSAAQHSVAELAPCCADAAPLCVVGTGALARAVLEAAADRNLPVVLVGSRHHARAVALAAEFGIAAVPFAALSSCFSSAGAAVCATSSPHVLVNEMHFIHRTHPITIIDLAMPHNVAPMTGLSRVTVVGLDALAARVGSLPPCDEAEVYVQERADEVFRRGGSVTRPKQGMENSAGFVDVFPIDRCGRVTDPPLRKREPFPSHTIRIGTRPSPLALKQVEEIIPVLQDAFCRGAARCARPTFEIVPIHTPGDLDKTTPLAHTDGSDFFTKTIEDALLGGEIDMAVHSAKDLEDTMPANLCIALMTESVSPHEALVTRSGGTLSSLPTGAVVGTSSPKRAAAIRALRPDLIVRDIRGTIEERIAQVDEGRYDALVVAHAALLRLGILDRMAQLFTADEMPPHPMQGRLAVQVRTDRRDLIERLEMSYAAR